MTTGEVQWELSVVISAGSSLLLLLLHNANQMAYKWAELPAAVEMDSEFITQTFLFLLFSIFFFFSPGRLKIRCREGPWSSRCIKLMTDHAKVEAASWLFNILSSEAILKLISWNNTDCGCPQMNPLPFLSPLKLIHFYLLLGCHRKRERGKEHTTSFFPLCQWEFWVHCSSSAPLL